MSRHKKLTNTFTAQSQLGDNYTINEYTIFEVVQYLNGEESTTTVGKLLETSSGKSVSINGKGEYTILDLCSTKVTSTDQNAP